MLHVLFLVIYQDRWLASMVILSEVFQIVKLLELFLELLMLLVVLVCPLFTSLIKIYLFDSLFIYLVIDYCLLGCGVNSTCTRGFKYRNCTCHLGYTSLSNFSLVGAVLKLDGNEVAPGCPYRMCLNLFCFHHRIVFWKLMND